MGSRCGPYEPDFPVGTRIRIADANALSAFQREWRLHHPLEHFQLSFAGREATISSVSFYHGGDELYQLEEIPGTWHEQCLTPLKE